MPTIFRYSATSRLIFQLSSWRSASSLRKLAFIFFNRLIVNDCFEGKHNAAIDVFLQALFISFIDKIHEELGLQRGHHIFTPKLQGSNIINSTRA
jgi:hypothetical protein